MAFQHWLQFFGIDIKFIWTIYIHFRVTLYIDIENQDLAGQDQVLVLIELHDQNWSQKKNKELKWDESWDWSQLGAKSIFAQDPLKIFGSLNQ